MMNYEKIYKEALERAKSKHTNFVHDEVIEYIFPELKESEDERIRKEILDYFQTDFAKQKGITRPDWIAWLEKQKETKRSIDYPNSEEIPKSFKIKTGYWYKCIVDNLAFFDKNVVYYCSKDGYLDQWGKGKTEKPIFINLNNIVKFRPARKNEIPHEPKFKVDDFIINVYGHEVFQVKKVLDNTYEIVSIADGSDYHITHDLAENIYRKWDVEKKELKKIEQKPTRMIQWKGDNLKEVIEFTGKYKKFDKWFISFENYERYVREHNNIFKLFNVDGSHFNVPVGAWIVKTPDGHNVPSIFDFKPKPTGWSEEDERAIKLIIEVLDGFKDDERVAGGFDYITIADLKDWLKSLKDRYMSQPVEDN